MTLGGAPGSLMRRGGEGTSTASSSQDLVRFITVEWGTLFVITSNHLIYRLKERDTSSKLNILYRKKLYTVAISLAHSTFGGSGGGDDAILDIYRMYGDDLYEKGDFEGAITQYSRTIGHVEPSYVIRKVQSIVYPQYYLY
jgi:hypothetical protein